MAQEKAMEISTQALLNALSNQRNAALNELAQAQAALHTAMAEIGKLTEEVAKLKDARPEPVIGDD